jgi:hypothetical protein
MLHLNCKKAIKRLETYHYAEGNSLYFNLLIINVLRVGSLLRSSSLSADELPV